MRVSDTGGGAGIKWNGAYRSFPAAPRIRKAWSDIMKETCCLSDIRPGEAARVCRLETRGSMRRRLYDIGMIENTLVECVGKSPAGDPAAYLIRGAVIAIRRDDCRNIIVCPL